MAEEEIEEEEKVVEEKAELLASQSLVDAMLPLLPYSVGGAVVD
jgi:hypothetical protein